MIIPTDNAPKEVRPAWAAEPPDPTAGIEVRPEIHKAGMVCFLLSETAFFSTLIMAYVIFLRHGGPPPTPQDTLSLPGVIANTLCLLVSSYTVHRADKALRADRGGRFRTWWALTMLLGVLFLVGTAIEWRGLIHDHGLTIGRNMFGTTYYTLVGFHAFHVTLGVIALGVVWGLSARGHLRGLAPLPVCLVGWYWHFVDVVWVVVFLVVYVLGR